MKEIILWFIIYVIVYLFYLFFVILRKKKLELFSNNTCYKYLVKVYHLNETNLKKMAHIIALANAFIIATTFIVIDFIGNFYLKMLVALITLLLLQLLTYHIIGTLLKRREKNV